MHTVRATMPVGPDRRAALDSLLEDAITRLFVFPMILLAICGFGVFPRQATDVWNRGGPWFIPLWRAEKKKPSRQRHAASEYHTHSIWVKPEFIVRRIE